MMKLRTELHIKPSEWNIGLGASILSLGSCFAEHIGGKLLGNKFQIAHHQDKASPFGTVFNPVSIAKSIDWLFSPDSANGQHFINLGGIWKHLDFHSAYAATSQEELEVQLSELKRSLHTWVKQPDVLLVTFGTAWVYEWKKSEEIVANCHKVPNSQFEKRLLDVSEITNEFNQLISNLPDTKIILTVSPVRHIKDTLELNSVSKSTLRLACHQLAASHPNVFYFPSYELLIDDLRDYRFYKTDMLHPSELAIDYVWQKFSEAYFDQATKDFLEKWQKIKAKLAHKPFSPNSDNHQAFLRKLREELLELSATIGVEEELGTVNYQLKIRK